MTLIVSLPLLKHNANHFTMLYEQAFYGDLNVHMFTVDCTVKYFLYVNMFIYRGDSELFVNIRHVRSEDDNKQEPCRNRGSQTQP